MLEDNYGQCDDAKVANIKALYNEMKLKEEFEKYEEESYQVAPHSVVGLVPPSPFVCTHVRAVVCLMHGAFAASLICGCALS